MYGFLRRPRWIALTVATVAAMVLMVNLSFWQLARLSERKASNRAVAANVGLPPAPVAEVLPATDTLDDIGDAEWRTVTAEGTWDVARQVLVNDRSFQGFPGLHVVTPLVLPDGRALLVNRGWVPAPTTLTAAPEVPDPPTGTVTVLARIRPTQTRGWLGPKDPATGTIARVARVDVARIGAQVPYPVLPAYAELLRADDGSLPRPLPLPELDEGPHLSYAGQWLLFTILAAAGWVAVVRRQLKVQRQTARKAELAANAEAAGATAEAGASVSAAVPAAANGDRPRPADDATTTGPGGTGGS